MQTNISFGNSLCQCGVTTEKLYVETLNFTNAFKNNNSIHFDQLNSRLIFTMIMSHCAYVPLVNLSYKNCFLLIFI